jgi:hypothetical protein
MLLVFQPKFCIYHFPARDVRQACLIVLGLIPLITLDEENDL